MPVSFTKPASYQGILALVGTLFIFGLASAVLSLALYFAAWGMIQVQSQTGGATWIPPDDLSDFYPEVPQFAPYQPDIPENMTLLGFIRLFNPDDYLTQFPPFKYLNYVKIMWYALLIPVFLGGAVYWVILAQGSGISVQQVVDYYQDVAWPTLGIVAAMLLAWIIAGASVGISLVAYPPELLVQGLQGLSLLGLTDILGYFFEAVYSILPYFPVAVEAVAFLHLLKEVTAGWIGNQW